MFQIGDLVGYDSSNKWLKKRSWTPEKETVGIVLGITTYKDEHQDEVQVRWNDGNEKVYFQEELALLSRG